MRRTLSFFLLLPLGLAVAWAGCAPVDEPAATSEAAPAPAPLPTPIPPDAETLKPPKEPSSPEPGGLQGRVETALRQIQERDLLTTNSFWTIFHGILGTGPGATLLDPATNRRVNAIEYIRSGAEVRGLEFIPTKYGLDVRTGAQQFVGQGHQDQFVAEMAEWGMTPETKFVVNGKNYTYADFINQTKMRTRVTQDQELSWSLVVLSQYLGTDARWTNAYGEKLGVEDVVRYELTAPVESAACGGTHRLFGLTWAYYTHLRRGGPNTGVWKEVAAHLADYEGRAHRYQNPDGAFSTRYLAGPGNIHDLQLRIGTTGHVLEWLSLALPDAELREPWMEEAASALALMILDGQSTGIESGALYHAAHGLRLYHDRVYRAPSSEGRPSIVPLPPGT
jgi:hypothetical protein